MRTQSTGSSSAIPIGTTRTDRTTNTLSSDSSEIEVSEEVDQHRWLRFLTGGRLGQTPRWWFSSREPRRDPHHGDDDGGIAAAGDGAAVATSSSEESGTDSASSVGSSRLQKGRYRKARSLTYMFFSMNVDSAGLRVAVTWNILCCGAVVGLFVVDSTTKPTVTTSLYWRLECSMTVIWGIEYMLRLWSCVEDPKLRAVVQGRKISILHLKHVVRVRLKYATQCMSLLDLASLLTLVVDLCLESNRLRGIAALRMLRLLTMYRIERDFRLFSPVLSVIWETHGQLLATAGLAGFVLMVSSVMMFYIEAPINDEFSTVLLSMWWCTAALTTVGYGDIVPKSGGGKLLAACVAFMGTGLFGLFAGILADGFREAFKRDRRLHFRSSARRHSRPPLAADEPGPNPVMTLPRTTTPNQRSSASQQPSSTHRSTSSRIGSQGDPGGGHSSHRHRDAASAAQVEAWSRLARVEEDVKHLRHDVDEILTLLRRLVPADSTIAV